MNDVYMSEKSLSHYQVILHQAQTVAILLKYLVP